jgi:hypothetical protein
VIGSVVGTRVFSATPPIGVTVTVAVAVAVGAVAPVRLHPSSAARSIAAAMK